MTGSPESPLGLGSSALSYLTILLNLIERRDWTSFSKAALQNPNSLSSLCECMANTDAFNGMSILHAVVRNRPPVEIVAGIIKICPDTPAACDCLNRTPLHVAAGINASVEVIKLLAVAYPGACNMQDEDGRTPLHFLCDVDCKLFEDDKQEQRDPPSFASVYALLTVSFTPVSIEDKDGMCPLEYAIFSDSDLVVVKLLQEAAQKYMKKTHSKRFGTPTLKCMSPQDRYESRMSRSHGAAA